MSYQLICASAHGTGIPDKSVHCIVTSPPYYALRQYAGEQTVSWPEVSYSPMPGLPEIEIPAMEAALGLEPTIDAYIGHLILVMREMGRVLRDDGVAWVNLGDSYAGSGGAHTHDHANPGLSKSAYRDGVERYKADGGRGRDKTANGLRAKNMLGVPWRFAFAAQADGWILRSDVIWAKKNCMPESVTDRPTKAHEYIFLLAKNERYFYDTEAIKEPAKEWTGQAATFARTGPVSEHILPGQTAAQHRPDRVDKQSGHGRRRAGFNERWDSKEQEPTRNKRDVWTIATRPYPGSHFAVFPPELPETCIRASTSAHGVCPGCGAPWGRAIEKVRIFGPKDTGVTNKNPHGGNGQSMIRNGNSRAGDYQTNTTGWRPSCTCGREDVIPATVCDPFNGSGTTGRVALQLGRSYIGVDLSEQYLTELAPDRLSNIQMELAL